jgi:hypothetical protein
VDLAYYGGYQPDHGVDQPPEKQETLNRLLGQSLNQHVGERAKALPYTPSYVYHTLVIHVCQREEFCVQTVTFFISIAALIISLWALVRAVRK